MADLYGLFTTHWSAIYDDVPVSFVSPEDGARSKGPVHHYIVPPRNRSIHFEDHRGSLPFPIVADYPLGDFQHEYGEAEEAGGWSCEPGIGQFPNSAYCEITFYYIASDGALHTDYESTNCDLVRNYSQSRTTWTHREQAQAYVCDHYMKSCGRSFYIYGDNGIHDFGNGITMNERTKTMYINISTRRRCPTLCFQRPDRLWNPVLAEAGLMLPITETDSLYKDFDVFASRSGGLAVKFGGSLPEGRWRMGFHDIPISGSEMIQIYNRRPYAGLILQNKEGSGLAWRVWHTSGQSNLMINGYPIGRTDKVVSEAKSRCFKGHIKTRFCGDITLDKLGPNPVWEFDDESSSSQGLSHSDPTASFSWDVDMYAKGRPAFG
jgi:hypothetical protein